MSRSTRSCGTQGLSSRIPLQTRARFNRSHRQAVRWLLGGGAEAYSPREVAEWLLTCDGLSMEVASRLCAL